MVNPEARRLRRLIRTTRWLLILFLPVMIAVQYLVSWVGIVDVVTLPVAIIYWVTVAGFHASVIFAKCPFCQEDLIKKDNSFSRISNPWSYKCQTCGKEFR